MGACKAFSKCYRYATLELLYSVRCWLSNTAPFMGIGFNSGCRAIAWGLFCKVGGFRGSRLSGFSVSGLLVEIAGLNIERARTYCIVEKLRRDVAPRRRPPKRMGGQEAIRAFLLLIVPKV